MVIDIEKYPACGMIVLSDGMDGITIPTKDYDQIVRTMTNDQIFKELLKVHNG